MAYFDDLGQHCSRPDCNQRDFLPIVCDLCTKVHCRDHAGYEAHECPRRAVRDKRVMLCPLCDAALPIDPDEPCDRTWERHAETLECRAAAARKARDAENGVKTPPKLPRCPAKGCKERLTTINSYHCASCAQTVCMKHRFEDTHQCKEASAAAAAAAAAAKVGGAGRRPSAPAPRDACACGTAARSLAGERAARAAESRMGSSLGVRRLMRRMVGGGQAASPVVRAR